MKDLYFIYNYNLRNIYIYKYSDLINTYYIPNIQKLIILIPIKNIENIDERQIYNYFYLFKFFLGRKAFFSKTKKIYHLGKWYYNFNIQIIINNKDKYKIYYYIYNNIFYEIDKNLIKYKYINNKILNKKYFLFNIINNDNSIFNEYKTNFGLFYLKSYIHMYIYILSVNNISKFIFLENILKKKIIL